PPTPNAATGRCLRSTRTASSSPGPSIARFLISVAPPLPLRPATRNVSSGSPACGTSFISNPRCVPTSTTSLSLPRDNHSFAMAIAGKTCPPVPPPAINNFTANVPAVSARRVPPLALASHPTGVASPLRLVGLLRNIQQHARCQQHDQQARPAIADKR